MKLTGKMSRVSGGMFHLQSPGAAPSRKTPAAGSRRFRRRGRRRDRRRGGLRRDRRREVLHRDRRRGHRRAGLRPGRRHAAPRRGLHPVLRRGRHRGRHLRGRRRSRGRSAGSASWSWRRCSFRRPARWRRRRGRWERTSGGAAGQGTLGCRVARAPSSLRKRDEIDECDRSDQRRRVGDLPVTRPTGPCDTSITVSRKERSERRQARPTRVAVVRVDAEDPDGFSPRTTDRTTAGASK